MAKYVDNTLHMDHIEGFESGISDSKSGGSGRSDTDPSAVTRGISQSVVLGVVGWKMYPGYPVIRFWSGRCPSWVPPFGSRSFFWYVRIGTQYLVQRSAPDRDLMRLQCMIGSFNILSEKGLFMPCFLLILQLQLRYEISKHCLIPNHITNRLLQGLSVGLRLAICRTS